MSNGFKDSLVDVTSFDDVSLDDGYGSAATSSTTQPSTNIVHQSMIKRFNQHSIMVLKTCEGRGSAQISETDQHSPAKKVCISLQSNVFVTSKFFLLESPSRKNYFRWFSQTNWKWCAFTVNFDQSWTLSPRADASEPRRGNHRLGKPGKPSEPGMRHVDA